MLAGSEGFSGVAVAKRKHTTNSLYTACMEVLHTYNWLISVSVFIYCNSKICLTMHQAF